MMFQQSKDSLVMPAWVAKFDGYLQTSRQALKEVGQTRLIISELGRKLDEEDAKLAAEIFQPALNSPQPLLWSIELLAMCQATWRFDGQEKAIG